MNDYMRAHLIQVASCCKQKLSLGILLNGEG